MRTIQTIGIGFAIVLLAVGASIAEDKRQGSSDGVVVKTEGGLRFKLPADWPLEKRNGILAPIPIEEYLSKRLLGIETRLQQLDQRVGSLDLRLRVIEEELKKQRLQSSERQSAGAP